jgi:hypothetical protein
MLSWPPPTDASSPLAMLPSPPLSDPKRPLAQLPWPLLTEASSPLALLPTPPPMEGVSPLAMPAAPPPTVERTPVAWFSLPPSTAACLDGLITDNPVLRVRGQLRASPASAVDTTLASRSVCGDRHRVHGRLLCEAFGGGGTGLVDPSRQRPPLCELSERPRSSGEDDRSGRDAVASTARHVTLALREIEVTA